MKHLLAIFLLASCFISCEQNQKQTAEISVKEHQSSLDGVWELVSYYNYKDNKVSDTVIANPENTQVKMYRENKVMWSRLVPKDSAEFFGYGTYKTTDSTLTETLQYGSTTMMKKIDSMRIFSFELINGEDTFSQIEIGPEGDRIYSENYKRIKD